MRKGSHPSWTDEEWELFYCDCISDYYLDKLGCEHCEYLQFGECKEHSGRCEDFLPDVDSVIDAVERAEREWKAGVWVPLESYNSEGGLRKRRT